MTEKNLLDVAIDLVSAWVGVECGRSLMLEVLEPEGVGRRGGSASDWSGTRRAERFGRSGGRGGSASRHRASRLRGRAGRHRASGLRGRASSRGSGLATGRAAASGVTVETEGPRATTSLCVITRARRVTVGGGLLLERETVGAGAVTFLTVFHAGERVAETLASSQA